MTDSSINHVVLTVRDLQGMAQYYETALGLVPLGGDGDIRRFGAGDQVLLELRGDRTAKPRDPRHAGLFHTAFLLPKRSDLGGWLDHAAQQGVRLSGASDHGVSEALYLDDPEGNGIEIYWDRPESEWNRNGTQVEMFTKRLDLNGLAAESLGDWRGMPNGSKIGHVHLQVGDLHQADEFFTNELKLTQSFAASGGGWYGWNGYHHHLAGNVWNSQGAGPRDPHMAGLTEIVLNNPARAGEVILDPWETRFRMI